MITRGQKIRLGIFVAVSLSAAAAMVIVLLGNELGQEQDQYTTRFTETVSGLEVGAPVKYHGVRVGTVESIRIDRENIQDVVVTLSLKHKTPVKRDTVVVLNTMGITGLKFLELTGGTDDSDFLQPGGEIPSGPSLMHRLTGKADVISEKIELLLNNLVMLTGDKQQAQVKQMLEDGAESLQTVRQLLQDNEAELNATLKNVSEASNELKKVAQKVDTRLDRAEGHIEAITRDVHDLSGRLEETIVEQNDNVSVLLGETTAVVESVRELLERRETQELPRGLARTVDEIQTLVRHTDERVAGLMRRLQDGAGSLHERISDERLDQTLNNMVKLSSNLDSLVQNMDLTMRQSREDIFRTLSNLEDVVRNLNDFTQMLLENPSILLRGSQLEERKL